MLANKFCLKKKQGNSKTSIRNEDEYSKKCTHHCGKII